MAAFGVDFVGVEAPERSVDDCLEDALEAAGVDATDAAL